VDLARCVSGVANSVKQGTGATNQVASGEDAGKTGHLVGVDRNTAPIVASKCRQLVIGWNCERVKTQSSDNPIRFNGKFGSGPQPE
jgi:hypothetical protein